METGSRPPGAPRSDDRRDVLAGLVRLAAQGDQNAFGRLYDLSSRGVYGLALKILQDGELADETTLEVYHQAWRQADRYDGERGSVTAWLLTIARSRALDRLRAESRRRARSEPLDAASQAVSDVPSPAEHWEIGLRRRRVHEALARLTAGQREAITLAYFEGLSQSEIASQLGRPLGTVKTRIRQGMIKLREHMAAFPEADQDLADGKGT